ncbi:MAG: transglutaminase family protein [Deltaproteobacteria bacterium]|nr:MAG: transglutaminase family protein [Deltaproteobacteria bacterium]
MNRFLAPNRYVDSDHPEVVAWAESLRGDSARESAIRLYYDVRERVRYSPWNVRFAPEAFTASGTLARDFEDGAHCIDKALLLAAGARVLGIPSRLHYANVRNHVGTARLEKALGSDLLVFHGYAELYLDDRWIGATPAFNAALCERLGVAPLEFDGVHDAIFQEFDGEARFMEYVDDHGSFADVPFERMLAAWKQHYGISAEWPLPEAS